VVIAPKYSAIYVPETDQLIFIGFLVRGSPTVLSTSRDTAKITRQFDPIAELSEACARVRSPDGAERNPGLFRH
jgi:hypothetical protein